MPLGQQLERVTAISGQVRLKGLIHAPPILEQDPEVRGLTITADRSGTNIRRDYEKGAVKTAPFFLCFNFMVYLYLYY